MNTYQIFPYIRYCVYRQCPSTGWQIETRTIPDNEFVLITSGKGEITISGKLYPARQGMLFLFRPGLPHSLKSSNESPMSFYAVHFSYTHLHYSDNNWNINENTELLPIGQAFETGSFPRLRSLLSDLVTQWTKRIPGYELAVNGLFLQFLYTVLQDSRTRDINYSSRQKVLEVMEYINHNLDKKLSVNYLAKTVNLSPDYLSSIFRSYTGYPLLKYINKCRIDRAKALLDGDTHKVRDVAALLGFRDEFYFSRVFKKYEGISPSEFCRKL